MPAAFQTKRGGPLSIYKLKSRFQIVLRPIVGRMYSAGITANQVTVFACAVSVGIGLWLYFARPERARVCVIPAWMLLRMGLNAIDGMLAREFGQQSKLGAFLNELTDVIADAALYYRSHGRAVRAILGRRRDNARRARVSLPAHWDPLSSASRRYDGPLGKSDRAFVFGASGLWIALALPLPEWTKWLMPLLAVLVIWTLINRVSGALREVETGTRYNTAYTDEHHATRTE